MSSTTSALYSDTSDEMHGAESCKEAVDLVVERIQNACEDVGGGQGDFVVNEDVVGSVHAYLSLFDLCTNIDLPCDIYFSLREAQRVTSVYAKMEYGVKRLLWLGG